MPQALHHLTNIDIKHIAFCKKGARQESNGVIMKAVGTMEDGFSIINKHIPEIAKMASRRVIYSAALSPNQSGEGDSQGDYVDVADVIAAHETLTKNWKDGNFDGDGTSDNHTTFGDLGYLHEVMYDETGGLAKAIGLPPRPNTLIVGLKITDDAIWKKYESGEYDAISIGGKGKQIPFEKSTIGLDIGKAITDGFSKLKKTFLAIAGANNIQKTVTEDSTKFNETYNAIIAEDGLWDVFRALRETIENIMKSEDLTTSEDKQNAVSVAIQQFELRITQFMALVLANEPLTETSKSTNNNSSNGGDDVDQKEVQTMIDDSLKKSQDSIVEAVTDKVTEVLKAAKPDPEKEDPKVTKTKDEETGSFTKKDLDNLSEKVEKIGDIVEKIAKTPGAINSDDNDSNDGTNDGESKSIFGKSVIGL